MAETETEAQKRRRLLNNPIHSEVASYLVAQPAKVVASGIDGVRGLLTADGMELENPNAAYDYVTQSPFISNIETAREENRDAISRGLQNLIGAAPAPATAAPARPAQAATPAPAVPTPAPLPVPKQTSFTNADITPELLARVNLTPPTAVQASASTMQQEQGPDPMLADLMARLAPPREQARLIRHTPEPRMASGPAEAARARRDRALDISERAQEVAASSQAADRQQTALTTSAQILGQFRAREQQLRQSLAIQQSKASMLTPEGRKSLAEAARIEEELAAIRAGVATGQLSLEQALAHLSGQQTKFTPVTGIAGNVEGVLNTGTGDIRPLAPGILDRPPTAK